MRHICQMLQDRGNNKILVSDEGLNTFDGNTSGIDYSPEFNEAFNQMNPMDRFN